MNADLRACCLGLAAMLLSCTPPPTLVVPDAGTPDAGAPLRDAGMPPHLLCVDGGSADGPYPHATYALDLLETAPDLTFDGIDETGQRRTLALHEYYEPCAATARLLLVRSSAAWCGTCRWDVAHTADLGASRLRVLDLLIDGDDVSRWRARVDTPGAVAADPAFTFGPLNLIHEALPFTVLIDTRTMTIRFAGGSSDIEFLSWRIQTELADLDGAPPPPGPVTVDHDGLAGRKNWELLNDMTLPGAPPADPTNAVADDPAAAALGQQLFADPLLSPSGAVSCATCHDPTKHFSDGRPTSLGVALGDRNAPSVLFAAHAPWQFWDGRADTLWMQALGPFENAKEMGGSRLFVDHAIFDRYAAQYEAVFGPLPALNDTTRFPAAGMPGNAVWSAMALADQQSATRVYANVGKAIAAYERTLRAMPNRLDAYLGGDLTALTAAQKTGLRMFFSASCVQCHYGPRLTDDAFHVLRFPTGRQDGQGDRGRIDGVLLLLASDLNAGGPYSDAPDAGRNITATPSMLGAFKTPPLRGVADTAPYGHGGALATLQDVAHLYSIAGLAADNPAAVGEIEPWVQPFSSNHIDELVPFLQVLTADPVP